MHEDQKINLENHEIYEKIALTKKRVLCHVWLRGPLHEPGLRANQPVYE